jgi:acetyl-CoA acetyltransferase
MKYADVAIPAGFAWSSPFVKWQGSLADVSSLDVAADVTARALAQRGLDPAAVDDLVLGWTVPQADIFYGAPLLAARIGAAGVTGPMISQACATSVACLDAAAGRVTAGGGTTLVVTADRTSNGPQVLYPRPRAQGGAPLSTNWVLDSFARDPWATTSMLQAGDAVAAESSVPRRELDELAALRSEQYQKALANDRAFQRSYMVEVHLPQRRGDPRIVAVDEGIRPVDLDQISSMPPAARGGLHTFATQTHPADGCAGAVVTTVGRARELSGGSGVVTVLATGFSRVPKTRMPEAPVPAARSALADAGLTISQVDAVTTHNPFAVNDIYFSRQLGYPLDRMNANGCSLIFGHPQGPTGLRSIAELMEELRQRGGGTGLFTGCAAGDTAAAVVIRVTD